MQFKSKNAIIQCSLSIWGRKAFDRRLRLVITNRLLIRYSTHNLSVENKIVAFVNDLGNKVRAAFAAPAYAFNFA